MSKSKQIVIDIKKYFKNLHFGRAKSTSVKKYRSNG